LVGNQNIGTMSTFERDPKTGKLASTEKTVPLEQAVCILFV
jgi:6-phosphogluconolactonase (cycloisomerase 2 family)